MADPNIWLNDKTHYPRIGDAFMGKLRDVYVTDRERENSYRYNNKFRFGPDRLERFLSIFFKGDPWENRDSVIKFVSYEIRWNTSFEYYKRYHL